MRYLVVILMLWAILGCQDTEQIEKPKDLIAQPLMEDILYDIALISGARTLSVSQLKRTGIKPDSIIYAKYGVDSLQLANSMNYYAVDFDLYTAMNQEVERRLALERKTLDSILERMKQERDSLRAFRLQPKEQVDQFRDSLRLQEDANEGLLEQSPTSILDSTGI
ncbi:DUF4296 domain-containing protein [Croceiramulus getboli]|nr:DUF4296 domain-containing protein [Flavobacteriaceae bacterium YJPT1-3]